VGRAIKNRVVAPLRSSAQGQQLYDPSGRGRSRCKGGGGRVQTGHAATLGASSLAACGSGGWGGEERVGWGGT
jgi:hypothetical protein